MDILLGNQYQYSHIFAIRQRKNVHTKILGEVESREIKKNGKKYIEEGLER